MDDELQTVAGPKKYTFLVDVRWVQVDRVEVLL
jgi:hypothetical protein